MLNIFSRKKDQVLREQKASLDLALAEIETLKAQRSAAPGFSAADYSRVTASMANDTEHIMRILRYQGKTLRARSRQVSTNNAYAAKFLQMVVSNVCGPQPFRMQAKVKYSSGKFDTAANQRLESEWLAWGKPGMCDFEGRLSFADMLRLMVRTLACDGEALIRIHEGSKAGPWGFQLQLIDVDRLDEEYNTTLSNGNCIISGVELDPDGRTVAFHLLKRKPSDWQIGIQREYIRIPAEQMIHLFQPLYAEQVRGVPWMYASIVKLHQLGNFEEAAIIAARVGASKMGFYQAKEGAGGIIGGDSTVDAKGNFIQDAEPGEFSVVPKDYELKEWSPNYPDAQVGPFMKSILRGVAVGYGVSYHTLGSDLESVNLSSARIGLLEERDHWMMLQQWIIEHGLEVFYGRWLNSALLRRKIPFPLERAEKYLTVYFQGRRWQWIDPLKEVNANIEAIKWKLKTRTRVIGESGDDVEDVFDEAAQEEKLAKEKGIEIVPPTEQGGKNATVEEEPPAGE